MLYEGLAERLVRVSELEKKLSALPGDKAAPDWISEIAKKTLNRREERHLAVVRTIHRMRRNIARLEALPDNIPHLKDRRKRLAARLDAMRADEKGYERFTRKLAQLDVRIAENALARKKGRIPGLKRRVAELENSTDLLTKEDVLNG